MEVLKGEDDLCSVEPGVCLAEKEQVNPMLSRELCPIAAISTSTRTKEQGPCQGICNEASRRIHLRVVCMYLGTYLKRPIFLKCENISPPGTYSSIMYRLELSCNDMDCLVSCFL